MTATAKLEPHSLESVIGVSRTASPIKAVRLFAVALTVALAPAATAQTPPPHTPKLKPAPPTVDIAAAVSTVTASRLTPQDRDIYARAFAAFDAEDPATALAIADTGTAPLPRDVLRWLDMQAPETTASFTAITAFIDAHPDWPLLTVLRRNAEANAAAPFVDPTSPLPQTPPATIIAWFERNPPLTGAGAWLYTSALAAGGDPTAAGVARQAWLELDFDRAVERRFLDQFGDALDTSHHDARLRRLVRARNTAAAARVVPLASPDVAKLARAQLQLMQREPGVDGAIAAVPTHLRDDPGLWFERLRWRRREGHTAGAIEILTDPPVIPDDPGRWTRERLILARGALNRRDFTTAYTLAAGHGLTEGATFADAEFLAGWIQLTFLDNPAVAFGHFRHLLANVRFPISRARGAYWSGRAAQAGGDAAAATDFFRQAAVYPTTFYGQLALTTLGRDLPPATPAVAATAPRILEHPSVAVAVELHDAGAAHHARHFLRQLVRSADGPADFRAVAELATALDRPTEALAVAKRAAFHGHDLEPFAFPRLPADAPIDPTLEAPLVHGLVRQESTFDARVVSTAGARGLMQLMPATAQRTARNLGLPYRGPDQLLEDPAFNVQLGQAYLAEMVARYDGAYILALAAYNAGPSRVDRWLRAYGDPRRPGVDAINWVESIPFSETRNYVQRVMEAIPYYRRILGTPAGGPAASASGL